MIVWFTKRHVRGSRTLYLVFGFHDLQTCCILKVSPKDWIAYMLFSGFKLPSRPVQRYQLLQANRAYVPSLFVQHICNISVSPPSTVVHRGTKTSYFVVLFFLYKICHYVQFVYTW